MTINIMESIKKNADKIMLLAPLVAFAVPLIWLHVLSPTSFDTMWKGRAFQLFFVWLILLELILGWEPLQKTKLNKPTKLRVTALLVALALPTIYVVISNYFGLNTAIFTVSKQSGIYWYKDMSTSIEYLAFAGFFTLMVFLIRSLNGLKSFSIPILFSTLIGIIFIIDSVYPNGEFTPFQFFVPATTMLAANMLGFMGYQTTLDLSNGNFPLLTVTNPNNPLNIASHTVAWPCAGIESLLIFTVVILLFLKRMPNSSQAKIGYFAVGAIVTYVINVFRIVGIFLYELGGGAPLVFHESYGPLFPIIWIVLYPLIILGTQGLWHRITNKNKQNPLEKSEAGAKSKLGNFDKLS